MITSAQATFSDKQAITASAASTNVLDLLANGNLVRATSPLNRLLAAGHPIPVLIQVTEAFATLTSLTVQIRQSDAENMSSPDVLSASGAIPAASLVAGFIFAPIWLPYPITKRYLDVNYVVAGSAATAGRVFAGISFAQTNGFN